MTQQIVTPANLGAEFDLGNIEAEKIHIRAADGVALDLTNGWLKANLANDQVVLPAFYAIAGVNTFETLPAFQVTLAAPGVYLLFAALTTNVATAVANQGVKAQFADNGVAINGSQRQFATYSAALTNFHTGHLLQVLPVATAPRTITVQVAKLVSGTVNIGNGGNGSAVLGYVKLA